MGMQELIEKRTALLAEADAITDAAIAEKRALTDDEKAKHAELVSEARGVRDLMDVRASRDAEAAAALPELRSIVEKADDAPAEERKAPATPRQEETRPVYGERSEASFFVDVALARNNGDEDARQRQMQNRAYTIAQMQKENRDLGNVSTKGAEAIPPLYLQDRFEKARIAKAVTSGLTNQTALPTTGDSVILPVQDGNASVAALTQADPLNTVSETTPTFTTKSADIVEVAGSADLSLYLVDRGTLGASVDVIVGNHLADLLAKDEDERVLAAVTADAGVAVTHATSTPGLIYDYVKIADAVQQIHSSNKQAPTAIVVHPRRFAKWASELDDNNRPLILPMGVAQNPLASVDGNGNPVAEGFTGYMLHGLPIYVDGNVTTTAGAGTNQDIIFVGDWQQQYTWLGGLMIDIDRSIMFKQSGLTVRARRYMATMCAHRAGAFAKITGTAYVTPTF